MVRVKFSLISPVSVCPFFLFKGGGLSFGDSEGRMSVLHVRCLEEDVAFMDNELAFWAEPDNVAVDRITVMIYHNLTYIILAKKNFLIIYGLNELGEVFDQKVCNVGCYYITGILIFKQRISNYLKKKIKQYRSIFSGIHHFDNIILVLTLPNVLKQYTLSVVNDTIHLEDKIIPLKINGTKYRTHGFFFSKNMVLFGMVASPCMLRSFSKLKTFLNVFIFHNASLNPLNILWNNNSGSLRDYWDCLEMLR